MGGWCPSLLVHSIEWRWCVLLLSRLLQWCGPCPTHPSAVLVSTAVMSPTVACRVCGCVGECVCLWCSCGGVSSVCSPLVVVVGGGIVDGGVALRDGVALY